MVVNDALHGHVMTSRVKVVVAAASAVSARHGAIGPSARSAQRHVQMDGQTVLSVSNGPIAVSAQIAPSGQIVVSEVNARSAHLGPTAGAGNRAKRANHVNPESHVVTASGVRVATQRPH